MVRKKYTVTESSHLISSESVLESSLGSETVVCKRNIGLFSASAFVIGSIIGTGIFVSPIGVLRYAGSVGGALLVWCGAGILSALGALCYVELGTTFPQSGSNFTYLRMCIGELPAFLYLWVNMLIIGPVGNAIQALTFANYVLKPFFPYCPTHQEAIRVISVLIIKSTLSSETVVCKRNIGLFSASAFVIGGIIGTGIFVSPIGILRCTGSVGGALLVWCSTGILSALGALCYVELGTTFPQSGSNFTYMRMCIGELPAFLYLWVYMLIIGPVRKVIQALTFSNYVLKPIFPYCPVPGDAIRVISLLIITLLTFINCRNVTWAARVAGVFTFAKVSALIIIILAGSYHLLTGKTQNFQNAFEGTTTDPGNIALAFYSGLFSYSGWTILNCVTEELKDPVKNLPRAILISLPVVTIIYILVNVAYFAVLPTNEILASNALAVTFGDRMLGFMSWIMPLSVALSTFGAMNGGIFAISRLFFVGAREGHLPNFLSMINLHYFTPFPSLVFLCLLSLTYLFTTEVYVLINYITFVDSLFLTLSVAGMVWMRYRQPDLVRPIKVPLFLILMFLGVCLLLLILPLYVSPWETGIGIGITIIGIPVYYVTVYWDNKPEFYRKAIGKVTSLVQKVFLSVPEEKCD